jgi:hypothetical protein
VPGRRRAAAGSGVRHGGAELEASGSLSKWRGRALGALAAGGWESCEREWD